MPKHRIFSVVAPLLVAGSAILFAGCKGEDDSIKVYKAPKEPAAGASVAAGGAPAAHGTENPDTELAWTAPTTWQPTAAPQFAAAAFATPDGLNATVSILSRAGGAPLPNINRWRGQLGLPPASQADLPTLTTDLHIGDIEAMGVDFAGNGNRILATLIPAGSRAYFFKLMGPAEKVAGQQANFNAWIKSIRPAGAAADPAVPAQPMTPKAEGPKVDAPKVEAPKPEAPKPAADAPKIPGVASYTLPAGWQVDATPKPMRAATLNITKNGVQATLIVSRLGAGAFGDKLSNINRWRQQVGLPPTENADAHPAAEVKLAQGPADLLDFTGPEGAERKRQSVAVTRFPKATDTWFFRFIGPHDLITQSAGDFDAFLKSIKFEE